MSTIIRDSFKGYAALTDGAQNFWDSISAGLIVTPGGRYATDNQCVTNNTSTALNTVAKASPSNDATCFAFVATQLTTAIGAAGGPFVLQFSDGATAQCSITFNNTDGSITVYSGAIGGTVVASFPSAFSGAGQWNGWCVKVVIHNTAGEVHIRKNGAGTDTYVATGINTRGGTTNNYANKYAAGMNLSSAPNGMWKFQDVWFYNATVGGGPSDFLSNDVRTFWQAPNSASQTQFTVGAAPIVTQGSTSGNTTYLTGSQYYFPFRPNNNGTLASCVLNLGAALTGHLQVGIYDATGSGGAPGNLLASSTVSTNPALGLNTVTFSSPPTVSNANNYYIAVIADANVQLKGSGSLPGAYQPTQAYASGLQSPAVVTSSSSLAQPNYTLTFTAANFAIVSDLIEDGTASTITSSTPGNTDLYGIQALPVTPSQILGVQIRGFMQKSDSNARSGGVAVKSGGTEIDGAGVALATTFENVTLNQDTDPATAIAWTPSGVNAMLIGPKCVA